MPRFPLPLGWSWGAATQFHAVPLATGPSFIHSAVIAEADSEKALLETLARQFSNGFVFKSCAKEFLDKAALPSSARVLLAHSAKLSLADFRTPKKVRQLAAKADGVPIAEAPRDVAFTELAGMAEVLYPAGDPVRYFYRTMPESEDRCFIARTSALTAGIVTMSRYSGDGWHVDLLLRHPAAPPGTMEQLLLNVITALKAEGIATLNLGEVPFVTPSGCEQVAARTRRELRAAQWGEQIAAIVAPYYNVAGLLQFKNKFEPVWEPRYYVGIPKLRLRDLRAFGLASGALALLEQALKHSSDKTPTNEDA